MKKTTTGITVPGVLVQLIKDLIVCAAVDIHQDHYLATKGMARNMDIPIQSGFWTSVGQWRLNDLLTLGFYYSHFREEL